MNKVLKENTKMWTKHLFMWHLWQSVLCYKTLHVTWSTHARWVGSFSFNVVLLLPRSIHTIERNWVTAFQYSNSAEKNSSALFAKLNAGNQRTPTIRAKLFSHKNTYCSFSHVFLSHLATVTICFENYVRNIET